ncbi:TetR/AcrR family transcriptional regulator [Nocardia otitidiscaviarum]|nr:TetR/AcrR family transcriptional regulator [Nocardia otitidiscaviarum]MCP9620544.1 TetR/AcrR family transcriptional regulator [Nocardia otitidiscaviarum]
MPPRRQRPATPAPPRKTPRQERSRAMVRRIVDAGEAVLVQHGYDGASTNRIAATAGISPGSLYQYFPDKDAIVSAVIERYTAAVADRVRAHVVSQLATPPEVGVPEAITVLLDALGDHPELLRAVVEQTPRLTSGTAVVAFEQQIGELARVALTLRREQVPADVDFDAAAWLLVRAVEHLTVRYVLDRPPIPRAVFLTEITRLVLNYFRPRAERER